MTQPICFQCDEPVADGDIAWRQVFSMDQRPERRAMHKICAMRAVIGGLNHLQGRCTCCGGTEPPDPPGLSRYEAAAAAVAYYRRFPAG